MPIAVFIKLRYKDPPQSPFSRGKSRSHLFAIRYKQDHPIFLLQIIPRSLSDFHVKC